MSTHFQRLVFGVAFLAAIASLALADATEDDWRAHWTMNHDGHIGNLYIRKGLSNWIVSYHAESDPPGKWRMASDIKLDDKNQHLSFKIDFDGYKQPFDLYIFSWDKKRFAGTTVWGKRTFGLSGVWAGPPGKDDGGE